MALADNFMWFPEASSDVEGETTDDWFSEKRAFELISFKFSIVQSDVFVPGAKKAGFNARKAAFEKSLKQGDTDSSAEIEAAEQAGTKFQEFTIKKVIDFASPKLYKACSTGARFPSAMLGLRKSGGEYVLYVQFIFRDVVVTSIEWDGGEGDKAPSETIMFAFKAMGFQYIKQGSTGPGGKRAPQEWRWSTATNSPTLEIQGLPRAPEYVPMSVPMRKQTL